jgi:hypothetical protein
MAASYYHDFTSIYGRQFRIWIKDADNPLTTRQIPNAGSVGVQYGDGAKKYYTPIVGSRGELTLVVQETDTAILTLISDIAKAQEGRFFLQILEDTGTGYQMYWAGLIMPELIQIPDTFPAEVRVQATDGLAALDQQLYKENDTTRYSGNETFVEMLARALHKTGIIDENYGNGASNYVLRTANNWFNDRMASLSVNPLDTTKISHSTWYKEGDETSSPLFDLPTLNAREVLEKIAGGWLSRVYQSAGRYWITQTSELSNATIDVFDYAIAANETIAGSTTAAGVSVQESITQNGDSHRLYLGQERYFEALSKVTKKYIHRGSANIIEPPADYDYLTPIAFPPGNGVMRFPASVDQAQLKISTTIDTRVTNNSELNNPGNGYDFYSPNGLTLKYEIKISDGITTWWLKRKLNDSQSEWHTLQRFYEVNPTLASVTPNSTPLANSRRHFLTITSAPLPGAFAFVTNSFQYNSRIVNLPSVIGSGGTYSLNVSGGAAYDQDKRGTANDFEIQYRLTDLDIVLSTDAGAEIDETIFSASNDIAVPTQPVEDLGDTPFGGFAGGYSAGIMDVTDGASYDLADDTWGYGSLAGTSKFNQLLVNEALSLLTVNRLVYDGTIKDPAYGFHKTALINGKVLIPIGVTWDLRQDEWSGTWAQVTRNPTEVSDAPTYNPTTRIGVGGGFANILEEASRRIHTTFSALAGIAETTALISEGDTVTSFKVRELENDALKNGDTITVYNPYTGSSQRFTVAADTSIGDTSISILGEAASFDFPAGSQFMRSVFDDVNGTKDYLNQTFAQHADADIDDTLALSPGDLLQRNDNGEFQNVNTIGVDWEVEDATQPVLKWFVEESGNTSPVLDNPFFWGEITADTGTTTPDAYADGLSILGGTDIDTSISGDTLTIDFTGTIPTIEDWIRADIDDTVSANTEWQDDKEVRFGNDNDSQIYYDSANNRAIWNVKTGTEQSGYINGSRQWYCDSSGFYGVGPQIYAGGQLRVISSSQLDGAVTHGSTTQFNDNANFAATKGITFNSGDLLDRHVSNTSGIGISAIVNITATVIQSALRVTGDFGVITYSYSIDSFTGTGTFGILIFPNGSGINVKTDSLIIGQFLHTSSAGAFKNQGTLLPSTVSVGYMQKDGVASSPLGAPDAVVGDKIYITAYFALA